MKKLFLAFAVVLLPTFAVAAEQSSQQPKKLQKSSTQRLTKGNHCARYGAGFVQVKGTTICMKIGGGVGF